MALLVKEEEVSDGLTGCCVGPGARLERRKSTRGKA